MEQKKKLSFIGLFLISAVATTLVFQNCSKVNYDVADAKVNPNGNVNRVITINTTFSNENADMKVLFIVDDSYTMSQSQTRLSNAIDSLMDPLFGRNVEFKVVSTSGIPSNEIDYKIDKKYFNPTNDVEIPESQISSFQSYLIQNTITNRVNERHPKLASQRTYNQTQFNTVKSKVKTAILNVGTNGSDTEEGFCPAVRQLFDTTSSSFFKAGDKAAVIFLTDEDDSSLFTACVSKYQQLVSNRPVVYYNYLEQRAKLSLEYQVNRDGIVTWIPVTWGVGLPNGQYFNAGGTCNASDVSIATQIINDRGYIVRNVSNCIYEAVPSTRYGADLGDDGSIPNKNLCTSPVVFQGITYANLYSYVTASNLSAVAGSCEKITQPANSITNTGVYTSVIDSDAASTSVQDLKSALINKSNELFGTGFIYASIIRKSNESCPLQTGQSYGVKYEDLSRRLPNNSVVESLCSSNFSSVLSRVSQFIVTSADKSYIVPGLAEGEVILSVSIKRNGQSTALTNSQYEAVGNTITLTNFTIQQGDVLEVSVGNQ